jgi:hypothetical protein
METRNVHLERNDYVTNVNAQPGAVSWAAVIAGATAAAALSLILLILGTGLGFSAVSPWAREGISGTTFGVSTIVWITLTSLLASGFGGYIAGRLRTRWLSVHADEVHFRDTAHGFLAWALATLVTASLLTSTIASLISGVAQTGAALTGAAVTAPAVAAAASNNKPDAMQSDADLKGYYLDMLFRRDMTAANAAGAPVSDAESPAPESAASRAEVLRIYTNALMNGNLPAEDARYVGQVVAQQTGINPADAEKRAQDMFTTLQVKMRDAENTARAAADKARKATAYGSLWLFVSLLIGAFVASFAAVFGGRQRDL